MPSCTNPAGRLYGILSSALRQPTNIPLRQVWATVFGLKPDKPREILACLVELLELLDFAESEVSQIPGIDRALYLEPFPPIRSALTMLNLDQAWQAAASKLNPTVMKGLQYCSDSLSRFRTDGVPLDELGALRSEIDSLYTNVSKSEIDADLKKVLLNLAESMRRSVVEFELRGTIGM